MKKWIGKLLLSVLISLVGISAVLIGVFYSNFISRRIYDDSTAHLEEIYAQVNRSFGAFAEKNWSFLNSCENSLSLADGLQDDRLSEFISEEQRFWKFSEFYFISSDGQSMTADGVENSMNTDDVCEKLSGGEPVMTGESLSDGSEITIFAIPVKHREYRNFGFDAIAVSYTNADMASSLNVDAFSGKAKCFVVHSDGEVLLSTQTGGNVFRNYLLYLKNASDIGEDGAEKLRNNWTDGKSGVVECKIGDVSQCILYQPVGYQDYILLSVVPVNVVSAGFLSVQKITTYVLMTIFLLIGASVMTMVIVRNKKQSRINKMELQYRELMFDVLSNSVDDIFIMLNSVDRNVDYVSPNIERLLGIPVTEARRDINVMKKCTINYDSAVIPHSELESIPLYENRHWECEYVHQHTGESRWYRVTVYNMSIQDVEKYIVVLSDRTQEQQMNRKLKEALNNARSANEAKSNFLSNMSHDIRTPMNAIVGFSVLLEKDADKPEKVREYTRKITASSHHLLSLINDVLDMSKIESGKTSLNFDCFSLPELLDELSIIINSDARAKNQKFRIHVQGTPSEQLLGDRLRLNQILINLLSNAVKYTPDGGKIDFTICQIPSNSPQYARLRFVVSDNGIGMSEDFQKQIFAPFSREISSVTNKIQGTGLGMAITKNLVDLMGGIIQLESRVGEGSTFTVELTFALPEQEEQEKWFSQRIKRILVADDEEQVCVDIKELMRDKGSEIEYVTDGLSAVQRAVTAYRSGEGFDVILLDLKMPAPDGIETARMIREKTCDETPILILTSYDWSEVETEARQVGINAFMSKPFFVSTFMQTVKSIVCAEEEIKSVSQDEPEISVMKDRLFLVAEDNELNAEILTEMLDMDGAKCELAVNGKEAFDMFVKSPKGYYDMILMDVQMPVMNGYDATKAIRASSHPDAKSIPITAMTANTFAEDVQNAMNSGMNGHLAKPVDMNAVRELVGKLLSADDVK